MTGFPTDEQGRVAEMTRACHEAIPRRQLEAVAAARPDLVVVLSSWEMTNREVGGTWYPFGSAESDAMLLRLYREAVDRLSVGGARVALVLLPEVVEGRNQSVGPEEVERGRHLNELITGWRTPTRPAPAPWIWPGGCARGIRAPPRSTGSSCGPVMVATSMTRPRPGTWLDGWRPT